ncbi:biogenesis of lysosome-related organelles complex 1 subunit 6-like [Mytilus californianus]|uniref:biogenesis of lysosome-related organelles complex 1 subunit 6-like n=1 Tax=Mytilus californianus TaxID=6549 RepID=UPI002246A62E|nr:biogenesis of lysosome-related organelles complex 1 subunit 6-like [Mytilus californianus]
MSDLKDDVKVEHPQKNLNEVSSDHTDDTNNATKEDVKTDSKGDNSTEDQGNSDLAINPETLEKLTLGFLSHCLPDLQRAKGSLTEILNSQNILHETAQNENSKFKINEDVEQTMAKVKLYHAKLLYLKREMNNLGEKSFKLKKRGIKLQQQKIKEELQKQEQEEKEKMREEMLTAKIAKKRSSSQSEKS